MIGFITTPETVEALNQGLLAAFAARGIAPYLTIASLPLPDGNAFVPLSDEDLTMPCYGSDRLGDYPETQAMIATLGGLTARVEMTSDQFTPPATP